MSKVWPIALPPALPLSCSAWNPCSELSYLGLALGLGLGLELGLGLG